MDRCPNCGQLLVPPVRKTLANAVRDTREADLKYLRETYPNVSTRADLIAAAEAQWESSGGSIKMTKEKLVQLSLDAWGKYLP